MNELDGRLLPGEKIRWQGRPMQGVRLTGRDGYLIPFSLCWCGFAMFWESSVVTKGAPFIFMIWGIPFVAIGLYFVVGRFFADAWLRSRTHYTITNRRVLIERLKPFGSFTALNLDRLPELELIEHSNGRGTIRFGVASPGRRGMSPWNPTLDPQPQFIGIDEVQSAFNRLQQPPERD